MKKTLVLSLALLSLAGGTMAKPVDKANGQTVSQESTDSQITAKQARQEQLEAKKAEQAAKKEEQKKALEQKKLEKCEALNEKIKTRVKNFDDKKTKHQSVYVNLKNRLNKFAAKFKAQGLNTAKLEADLAILDTKISKFKADYDAYVVKMEESRDVTCGESQGQFRGKLSESKTLLRQVHADAADIRNYLRTTIKADLKSLKAEWAKLNPETEDELGGTKAPKVKKGAVTAPTTTPVAPTTTTTTPATTTDATTQPQL